MNKTKLKLIILISSMLFISGCFKDINIHTYRKDIKKEVSTEDRKLISSIYDKVLFYDGDIRITQNGFYPDCMIPHGSLNKYSKDNNSDYIDYCFYNKFMDIIYSSTLNESMTRKKFNFKKFITTIKSDTIKNFRIKLLSFQKEYPSFESKEFTKIEIDKLLSKNSSLYEKQKILIKYEPNYLKRISNPSKKLLQELKKAQEEKDNCIKRGHHYWSKYSNSCEYYNSSQSNSNSGSSSSSSSGGGYSSSSSSNRPFNSMPSNASPGRGYYRPGVGYSY